MIDVLLGMPRAGTTFLYHNLAKHPGIFVPFRRKTNYYAIHYYKNYQYYSDHFLGAEKDQILLDTDTLSFLNTDAYERFMKKVTDEKVILVLRDPADWMVSLYNKIATFTNNMPSFQDYLKNGFNLIEDGASVKFLFPDGEIEKRIKQIQTDFGNRLLLVPFEAIATNPLGVLKSIEVHLGVDQYFSEDNIITGKVNSSDDEHGLIMSWLLRQNWVIAAIRILPRSLILRIRQYYDTSNKSGNLQAVPTPKTTSPNLEFARHFYKSDTQYVSKICSAIAVDFK